MERGGENTDKIVQLDGCNTSIDTTNDFLGDLNRVYMVHVQTIAQSRDTRRDLVKLNALLTSI